MREGIFQRALEIALNAPTRATTRAWRQNSGELVIEQGGVRRRVRLAPPGSGDIVVIVKGGLYVEIETKASRGKLRDAQKARAKWLNSWGALHVSVRPQTKDIGESVRLAMEVIDAAIARRMEER